MKCIRLLAAAALGVSIACGVAFESAAQKKVVIRSVPIGNLRILDPIWTTAYITRNHAYMVWDTLFSLDADNKPQPQMVDTWSVSDDKLTYTFTLRDGLKWHDGPPVTAADCVQSLKRWGAKDGMGQALMSYTAALETVDAKTFKLVLKQPVGFVIDALAKIDSNVPFMMPERIAKTDPNTQITEMIGSGPFRFVASEWVPGSKVVYEKFTDYVPRKEPASQAAGGKVVYVDRVESIYIPDHGVAMAALASGELDLHEFAGDRPVGDGRRPSGGRGRAERQTGLAAVHVAQPPASAVRQEGSAPGGAVGDEAGRVFGRDGGRRQALHGLSGDLRLRPAG